MEAALDRICQQRRGGGARAATTSSCCPTARVDAEHIAVPSLLAVAAVHHHLIRDGLRTEVGLVVETGEARQLHDFCLLAGYGAEAINPYLAFDTLSALQRELGGELATEAEAQKRYIKAIAKGILKVMSKMGICTFQSYCGAQIFDAVGPQQRLPRQVFHRHRLAGRGHRPRRDRRGDGAPPSPRLRRCAQSTATRSIPAASSPSASAARRHVWTSDTVSLLQHAVRGNNYRKFKEYTRHVGDQEDGLISLRGLLDFNVAARPIPLDEVEPAADDRQAVLDRRHVLRLDLVGGAHHARHRA